LLKSSDDFRLDTYICGNCESLTTRPPDKLGGLFDSAGMPVDETDCSAMLGKQNSCGSANTCGCACNDRNLAFKVHVPSCLDRNFGGFH
jgi:hypothetical protein